MTPLAKTGFVVRLFSLAWTAMLIGLMATGTLSSARIGAMTWGPSHDIWSAAIAISQINFGLSGKLAYKEIEQAIANEVTGSQSSWSVMDDTTRRLLKDPSTVTGGLLAGGAVKKDAISIPSTNEGYVTNWCEDLGYADFYNLAFRLFGLNAYSTHWLYMSILAMSCLLFAIAFFRDNLAIGTLTLSITALFIESSSSIFSELLPSFAANRFLSTLALVPMLHIIHAGLRRRPLGWSEIFLSSVQALFLAFAISARSSAQWCVVAFIVSLSAVIVLRRLEIGMRAAQAVQTKGFVQRFAAIPYVGRVGTIGLLVLAVTTAVGLVRNAQIDERYFWEDNLPHHLFWHSAYIALTLNPDWSAYRPFPDVPLGGDGAGFKVFEHRMQERGQPIVSTTHEIYANYYLRARAYESLIRNEYIKFIIGNPHYTFRLFTYYKPNGIFNLLVTLIGSTAIISVALALVSLASVIALVVLPHNGLSSRIEFATTFCLLWLCSLLPVLWAYPSPHVFADQLWSTLFALLALLSFSTAALVRMVLWRGRSDSDEQHAVHRHPPYMDQHPVPASRVAGTHEKQLDMPLSEAISMEVALPETVVGRSSQGQAAEIKMFCLKVAIVAVAAFIFILGVFLAAQMFVDRQLAKVGHEPAIQKAELRDLLLKGGSGIVVAAERRLYALADQEDLPPERKAKIIAAIKKVSARYRPYLEAAETPARD
jgi:hypothetical protein